ncbi:MAG: hypothetical protein ACO3O3_08070 [Ilumatobacteraceae bacterium]
MARADDVGAFVEQFGISVRFDEVISLGGRCSLAMVAGWFFGKDYSSEFFPAFGAVPVGAFSWHR